MICVQVTW